MSKKEIALIVVGALVVLGIFGSSGDDNEPTSKPVQTEVKTETQAQAPAKEPIELSGIGKDIAGPIELRPGLLLIAYSHNGTSNFIAWLKDAQGNNVGLLANDLGSSQGRKALQIRKPGQYIIDIQADGNWGINLSQ